ncbi:hypothetical protein ACVISU_002037 [Bradyrhizobium sp. USDA 4452]
MRFTFLALALTTIAPSGAMATTCSAAVQKCISAAGGKNIEAGCKQAGETCMKTGTFVGPVTGKVWNNLLKK